MSLFHTIKKIYYFLIIGLVITACSKNEKTPEPVAKFTPSATTVETKDEITFTNSSTNASTYLWDFGDGNTSTQANPTYQYAKAGTYTVKLTASNGGQSNTTSSTVTVKGYFVRTITVAGFPADSDPNTPGVQPWDSDGTTADVYFIVGPASTTDNTNYSLTFDRGNFVFSTTTRNNAVSPFTYTYNANLSTSEIALFNSSGADIAGAVELTTGDYILIINDEDTGSTPAFQRMFGSVFTGLINNRNTLGSGGTPINFFTSNGTTATFGFSTSSGWQVSMTCDVR